MVIGSYNVDTLRTVESTEALLHNLKTSNVDIAGIQETHNENTESIKYENYTIYYGGCTLIKPNDTKIISRRAGVAIAIKNSIKENIIRTERISDRIMTMTLKTDKTIKNIQIANSYAPHHGYDKSEQDEYWISIKTTSEMQMWI